MAKYENVSKNNMKPEIKKFRKISRTQQKKQQFRRTFPGPLKIPEQFKDLENH